MVHTARTMVWDRPPRTAIGDILARATVVLTPLDRRELLAQLKLEFEEGSKSVRVCL